MEGIGWEETIVFVLAGFTIFPQYAGKGVAGRIRQGSTFSRVVRFDSPAQYQSSGNSGYLVANCYQLVH